MSKFFKYVAYFLLSIVSLLVIIAVLLQLSFFQNFLKDKATAYLSNRLETKVQMDHIRIDFFNKISFKGLYIEDRNKDTLLYAQSFEGRLTDWLQVQERVKVTYIKLSDARVQLNRPTHDSIWNYQFIIDAFASDKKDSSSATTPEIVLDYLELDGVRFDMLDAWYGSDMVAHVGNLVISGESFVPAAKQIIIDKIEGDKIYYGLRSYLGGKQRRYRSHEELFPLDTTAFNPDDYRIQIANLSLKNSHFRLRDDEVPDERIRPNEFDAAYLDITNINIDISNTHIIKDTIIGRIDMLTADERSGIKIKQLTADARVSPIISELKNLRLVTNKSTLGDYYAMHYDRFPAFVHYIDSVRMETRLDNATVAMDDVAYFARPLDRWSGQVFRTSGYGYGTVANLTVKNFITTNGKTNIQGDYSIVGLPDIDKSIMKFSNGSVTTDFIDLITLFPEIKALDIPQLSRLNKIKYQGNFDGFYNNFILNGYIDTDAGSVRADRLSMDYRTDKILYNGSISSDKGIDLATLFPNQKLGSTAFDLIIDGDGFDYTRDNIKAKGSIAHLDYNGYRYKSIYTDVSVSEAVIHATVNSKDANAYLDLSGNIYFIDEVPRYEFKGFIDRLLPQSLGLYDDYLFLSGAISGDIRASSFKNLVGDITAEDLFVIKGQDTLNINELSLNSQRSGLSNQFAFNTNGFQVLVDGTFYIDDLYQSSQAFLSYYLPDIIRPPVKYNPNQSFSFSIKGDHAQDLVSLATKDIIVSDKIDIRGNMDAASQQMNLHGSIPYLILNNIKMDSVVISSEADIIDMNLSVDVKYITTADKVLTRDVGFTSRVRDNQMHFELATGNQSSFGTAKIVGDATARNDSFYFSLQPSELFFNNNKWDITSGSQITVAQDFLGISNLNIKSDDQWIRVNNNIYNPNGNTKIALENINIQPLLRMIDLDDSYIRGRIFGTINAPNLMISPDATFDLYTDTIKIEDKDIGFVQIKGAYDNAKGSIILEEPSGIYDKIGRLDINGYIYPSSDTTDIYNLRARARNTSLKWAIPFVDNLVKNLDGFVNGDLEIIGNRITPVVKGKVLLSYAKFTPIITGVPYQMPNALISITPDEFIVNNVRILDDERNAGLVNGSIMHDNFDNIRFNLNLVSDYIKVLSLQPYEGENFYGTVYADTRLNITGPLDQMNLDITAVPQGKSKLYIPLTGSADLSSYDYISFVSPDKQGVGSDYVNKKTTRVNLNIDAVANENLEAIIIMDPISGEQIVAKGNGNITLFVPDEGQIRLNGNYNIVEGYYDFTFNQLQVFNYKRRFLINDGSSITWSGDIANAAVNVTANTKVKARLYDLIINDIDRISPSLNEISDAQTPQNVIVGLSMTGNLLNPDLKFQIDLEENRSIGSYAYQKLRRINTEDRELLNQVVSLLLVEQFIPPEGINSGAMAVNAGVNNISEVVSSFASGQLTNLTNRILGVEDLSVDFKYKYYNIADGSSSANTILNRNVAGLSFRKNFFNDRIILNVGGIYDWGESSGNNVQSGLPSNLAGDFRLQYVITPDGRLRLNIFRTSNFDAIFLQNIGRHGVGLSYRRSFNTLRDFFNPQYKIYSIKNTVDTAQINKAIDTNAVTHQLNI